jgi:hypothetical protein
MVIIMTGFHPGRFSGAIITILPIALTGAASGGGLFGVGVSTAAVSYAELMILAA